MSTICARRSPVCEPVDASGGNLLRRCSRLFGGGMADRAGLVHFGDSDFEAKYQTLIENIGQWRAKAGRVESVDLRFSREAVVNPDMIAAGRRAPAEASCAAQARGEEFEMIGAMRAAGSSSRSCGFDEERSAHCGTRYRQHQDLRADRRAGGRPRLEILRRWAPRNRRAGARARS